MNPIRQAVDDYLALRRSLGFKLTDYPWMLHDFAAYLEAAGASAVTAELAVAWANCRDLTLIRPISANGSAWCEASPAT